MKLKRQWIIAARAAYLTGHSRKAICKQLNRRSGVEVSREYLDQIIGFKKHRDISITHSIMGGAQELFPKNPVDLEGQARRGKSYILKCYKRQSKPLSKQDLTYQRTIEGRAAREILGPPTLKRPVRKKPKDLVPVNLKYVQINGSKINGEANPPLLVALDKVNKDVVVRIPYNEINPNKRPSGNHGMAYVAYRDLTQLSKSMVGVTLTAGLMFKPNSCSLEELPKAFKRLGHPDPEAAMRSWSRAD